MGPVFNFCLNKKTWKQNNRDGYSEKGKKMSAVTKIPKKKNLKGLN